MSDSKSIDSDEDFDAFIKTLYARRNELKSNLNKATTETTKLRKQIDTARSERTKAVEQQRTAEEEAKSLDAEIERLRRENATLEEKINSTNRITRGYIALVDEMSGIINSEKRYSNPY